MNRFFKLSVIAAAIVASIGCTRIETGEVGLRVGFDKQVAETELLPGSFNQTLIGDVLRFQVRSTAVQLDNKTPQTADNSTLKDFDLLVLYEVSPAAVSYLWTKQSRALHSADKNEIYLMYNYVANIANSAVYKAVRKYKALEVADNRANIEQEVKRLLLEAFKEEKLDDKLTVTQVQVRNVMLADDIVNSANAVVRRENEYKAKVVEVQTAQKEADRIAILNSNKGAIEYMHAMATVTVAEAIKEGKVHTILIPHNMNAFMLNQK